MQLRLVQAAVRKLVKRIYFRSAKERVPQMWCVDDGAFITAVVDDQAASVAAAHDGQVLDGDARVRPESNGDRDQKEPPGNR